MFFYLNFFAMLSDYSICIRGILPGQSAPGNKENLVDSELIPYIDGSYDNTVYYAIDSSEKLYEEANFFMNIDNFKIFANQKYLIKKPKSSRMMLASILKHDKINFSYEGLDYVLYPADRLVVVENGFEKTLCSFTEPLFILDAWSFYYTSCDFFNNNSLISFSVRFLPDSVLSTKLIMFNRKKTSIQLIVKTPVLFNDYEIIFLKFIKENENL